MAAITTFFMCNIDEAAYMAYLCEPSPEEECGWIESAKRETNLHYDLTPPASLDDIMDWEQEFQMLAASVLKSS